MVELEEFAPNRWRIKKPLPQPARSTLPLPFVISDTMDPTEQVDGKFYTSKRQFRAVGRALGLTEVGNEKLPPITRSTTKPATRDARKRDIRVAMEKYKSGLRPGGRRV